MHQERLETMTSTSHQSQRILVVHKLERTHNLKKTKKKNIEIGTRNKDQILENGDL